MRYFRAVNADIYEAVRADLDGVWGYPNEGTKTSTAITPAAAALKDSSGRVYLIASPAECEYPAIAERLPALLASGVVEEITAAAMSAEFPQPF